MLHRIRDLDTPDFGDVVDDLGDLVEHAAEAITAAAGVIPGVADHRAAASRRRGLGIAALLVIALVAAYAIKRRRDSEPVDVPNDV